MEDTSQSLFWSEGMVDEKINLIRTYNTMYSIQLAVEYQRKAGLDPFQYVCRERERCCSAIANYFRL